jgi:TolB-like protein
MKSICSFLVFILVLSIFSCVSSPPSGSGLNMRSSSSSTSVNPTTVPGIDELDIAIRDASDYLNENIPKGNKIVILNVESASPDLSDYIIDELIANAVNDKVFTVVDRQQLDAIRSEQNFQLSGEVDDDDALAIGKFFGAQTIVSGAANRLGTGYRIRIRALDVQTAQVQGQYNRNIVSSRTINSLLASGSSTSSGSAAGTNTTTSGGPATGITASGSGAASNTNEVSAPPITGTIVPGGSLAEKLAWLQRSADSHNTYILEVTADENIAPHVFEFSGGINITVVLRGVGANRTVRLRSNGTMFTINDNVTFILDNNITLMGYNQNTSPMVSIQKGIFKMNAGSVITGNNNTSNSSAGGGVFVRYGTFEMAGGTISGNAASYGGGGVSVVYGTFDMAGGTISGNTANQGGGVYVGQDSSSFTMTGGIISGNTASRGGGVCLFLHQTLNMSGGTITGNIARESGGGVYVGDYGRINKGGGTITGYSSDQTNGNVVKDNGGNILARRGHAVFVSENNRRKETTAGPGVSLKQDTAGGWDN